MTFEEWFQNWRSKQNAYGASALDAERDDLEDAWDAAMEEAARTCFGLGRRIFRNEIANDCRTLREVQIAEEAAVLCGDEIRHRLTSAATPAPPEEAPGAGSYAPGEPAPGPRREPG
jgi:hypothetical protein